MRFTFFLPGIFISKLLFSYSSGPPGGYHGQYSTCTSCHSGSAVSGVSHVSISGLPSSYTPGNTYNLILNLSAGSARGYGFQMAVKDNSSFSGTLNTSHSGTRIDSNYFEHTRRVTDNAINFSWTAPSNNAGDVTFYLSALATGGSYGTSGDTTYVLSETVQQSSNDKTLSLSSGTGGTVSGGGTYAYGTNVTITATPSTGYTFNGWSGTGVTDTSAASTTVSMTSDRSVSASFSLINHTLSLSAGAGGTVSGGGNYGYGTSSGITATPDTGYSFVGWSGTGVNDASASSTTVSMTSDVNLYANFDLSTVQLSFSSSLGGRLTGDGNYPKFSTVTINAFPEDGYKFDRWIGENVADPMSVSTTVELNNSIQIEASFSIKPVNTFNLSTTSIPLQGGTTSGSGNFEENKTATVFAVPSEGYSFVKWIGEGLSDGNGSISLIMDADINLTAHFELNKYQVAVGESLGGSTSGSGFYEHGTTLMISALPDEGFHFKKWTGEGINDAYSQSIFVEIVEDKNFTAMFERNKYDLEATASTGGTVNGSGNFVYGEKVTVKALPHEGYEFDYWIGLDANESSEISFILNENKTIEAVFKKITLASSPSAKSLGANWFEHWFGYFYEDPSGWAYHTEFGWIFLAVQNDGSIWFWSENFSWLWVDESTRDQNLYWKEDEKSWVYFALINSSNKIYYSYNNQQWLEQKVPTDDR